MANANSNLDPDYQAILVINDTNNATVYFNLYASSDPICWLSLKSKSIEPGKQYFYRSKKSFKFNIQIENDEKEKSEKSGIKHEDGNNENKDELEMKSRAQLKESSEKENSQECNSVKKKEERKKEEEECEMLQKTESAEGTETDLVKEDEDRRESLGKLAMIKGRMQRQESSYKNDQQESNKTKEENENKRGDMEKEIQKANTIERNEEEVINKEDEVNMDNENTTDTGALMISNTEDEKNAANDLTSENSTEDEKKNEKQNEHEKDCPKKIKRPKKTNIVSTNKLKKENKLVIVKQDGRVEINDLSEYPDEHQICIRRKNMEDETSPEMGRDLYAILVLNEKDVRKLDKEKQDKIIKQAYHRQMRLFHPDRNPDLADNHICQEIIMAYGILGHREKRAQYHDLIDYRKGWRSFSRWKAIFKPEAHGSREKWKRIGLLSFSFICLAGGVVLGVFTAGAALPLLLPCAAAAGGIIGGAVQGAFRVMSYDTIHDGVTLKKYAKSFGIGAACGAVAGVASAGVTIGILGAGNAVFSVAEGGIGTVLGNGAATGAVTGIATSISNDIDGAVVDGQKLSAGNVLKHAAIGAVFGSGFGVAAAGLSTLEAKVRTFARRSSGALEAIEDADRLIKEAVLSSCLPTNLTPGPEQSSFKDKQTAPYAPHYEDNEEIITNEKVMRYICNEKYFSRMVVEYLLGDVREKIIKKGSGSTVEIPENATDVEVRFQVMRFPAIWCDVKKYDRERKCWYKPTVPHVFKYETPVSRTFTLEGTLCYEAVMKVTNEVKKDVPMREE